MELRTLEDVSVAEIAATFNEAFTNYFVPLRFTEEGMAAKIRGEGIDLRRSVGAFNGGRLAGFILHGYDVLNGVPTLYNAGTGVLPAERGRGLTAALYRHAVPLQRAEGIRTHLLEVIDANALAIRVYEAIGFTRRRTLAGYRSTEPITAPAGLSVQPIASLPSAGTWHEVEPAWQNTAASVARDPGSHQFIGVEQDGILVGYAAYAPATGRVKLCAVHPAYRRRGIGRALFAYLRARCPAEVTVTNVDTAATGVAAFLQAIGFRKMLGLYEMQLVVP
ncbi:MAG TPA: GNAT family N-acetyltransferase [Myxococcaceae bacterium]|nr:GNAT family N-acetyltransferase [Myxococcaceae bacterium]